MEQIALNDMQELLAIPIDAAHHIAAVHMGQERRPCMYGLFKHGILDVDDIPVLQGLPGIGIDQVENHRRGKQHRVVADDQGKHLVQPADEDLVGQHRQVLRQKQRHRVGDEDTQLRDDKQTRIFLGKLPNPFQAARFPVFQPTSLPFPAQI